MAEEGKGPLYTLDQDTSETFMAGHYTATFVRVLRSELTVNDVRLV